MKRTRTGPIFLLLLLLPATAITLPWDKDMRDQPSVKPQESKVETNPASVPIALDVAIRDSRVKRGQLVLMEAFGGGFTWGSILMRY